MAKTTAEWLAERAARGQPPVPQYQPPPPPQQYQTQQPQPQWNTPYPQYAPQQPQAYAQSPGEASQSPVDGRTLVQAAVEGKISWGTVASHWKGGRGNATETELCPACGGNQFFQRKANSKMGVPPAPFCNTCGFNGMFTQYGAGDGAG